MNFYLDTGSRARKIEKLDYKQIMDLAVEPARIRMERIAHRRRAVDNHQQ